MNNRSLTSEFDNILYKISDTMNLTIKKDLDYLKEFTDWSFILDDYETSYKENWVIIHISTPMGLDSINLHSSLYPANEKNPDPIFRISEAAYCISTSQNKDKILPYWEKNLGIPLYFLRFYEGHKKGEKRYIEFNQLVTHLLDLHFSERLETYCALDDQGEEVEHIKVYKKDEKRIVLFKRETLDKLLNAGEWVLLRKFEFRCPEPFFLLEKDEYKDQKYNIKLSKNQGKFYLNTRFLNRNNKFHSEYEGLCFLHPKNYQKEEKKYCSFIIYNPINDILLGEYNLNPKNFTNSSCKKNRLLFERGIIFFNSEVLNKYKNDDKYTIEERRINCRGSWTLIYDINERNQVFTYPYCLAELPYKEQNHWKQHNEKKEASISIPNQTEGVDFKGEKLSLIRSRMDIAI